MKNRLDIDIQFRSQPGALQGAMQRLNRFSQEVSDAFRAMARAYQHGYIAKNGPGGRRKRRRRRRLS